jgi:hypothetical protein
MDVLQQPLRAGNATRIRGLNDTRGPLKNGTFGCAHRGMKRVSYSDR